VIRWRQTLFVHWLVPPDVLNRRLPPNPSGLTLDSWRGHGVVSLVVVELDGPAPQALLDSPMGNLVRHRQLSVRTYVDGPDGPGLMPLETRVDRLSYALSARLSGLPHRLDRHLRYEVRDSTLTLRADGLALDGTIASVPPETLAPGSLERFATARERLYAAQPGERLQRVALVHPEWRARPVTLAQSLSPPGLAIDVAPASAHVCEDLEVVLEPLAEPLPDSDEPTLVPA
jgi:uncharacterized protein YqjF (DUF2071 family)